IPMTNPSAIATIPTNRAIIPFKRQLMGSDSLSSAIGRVRYTGWRCLFNRAWVRLSNVLRPPGRASIAPAVTDCFSHVGFPDRSLLFCDVDRGLRIMPKAMFLETVVVDGHSCPRFQFLAVS